MISPCDPAVDGRSRQSLIFCLNSSNTVLTPRKKNCVCAVSRFCVSLAPSQAEQCDSAQKMWKCSIIHACQRSVHTVIIRIQSASVCLISLSWIRCQGLYRAGVKILYLKSMMNVEEEEMSDCFLRAARHFAFC